MRLLQKAATQDPRFTAAFMRVAGLIDPPETLMRPALIISVLRQLWRKPALPSVPQRTVARPRSKAAAR